MNAYLRIIDVNLNRLREGLRVLEDICRLFLEDNDLTSRIKRLRHLIQELENPSTILNRNSEEDLGRDLNPESEFQRKNWRDLILSSSKRTQEASRSLEEVYKTLDINKSKLVKNIRFELYDIEKKMIAKLAPLIRNTLPKQLLYFIATPELCEGRETDQIVEQALKGGAGAIQLRSKKLSDKEMHSLGKKIKTLCKSYQSLFIVNDRIDLALALQADGVHLGQNDMTPNMARALVGPDMIIGQSCHNLIQLKNVDRAHVDYVGIGPVFPTSSKDNPDPVIGLELVKQISSFDLPVVAIGGIHKNNLLELVQAGCYRIAVISALSQAENVEQEARNLSELLEIRT